MASLTAPLSRPLIGPIAYPFGHTPGQGVGGAAPTVANQTIAFGALTLASAGGAKALNSLGAEVDFVSVDSVVSGTGTGWSVSSGRLIRSSTPATSDGAVLRCTTSLGVVDITISTIANAYSILTKAEMVAVFALGAVTVSGKSVYGRRGVSLTGLAAPDTTFKNRAWTSTVTVRSHDTANPLTFDQVNVQNTQFLTFKECKFTIAPADNTVLISIIGLSDNIVIDGNEICSTVEVDPTADWSAGYYTSFNAIGTGNSSGLPIGLTFVRNRIHDVRGGIVASCTGALVIDDNEIYRCFEDNIKVSYGPTTTHVGWNDLHHSFGQGGDGGSPHCDGIQFAATGAGADWTGITIVGNNILRGNARAANQGIFLDDMPSGVFYVATIQANIVDVGAANSIKINRAKACTVQNNTVVGPPDALYGGSARVGIASIIVGDDETSGTNIVLDNIAEGYSLYGTYQSDNNVTLGLEVAAPYTDYTLTFDGPTFNPDTIASLRTLFSMRVAGSADGTYNAGAIGTGYADFDAMTYTAPRSSLGNPAALFMLMEAA